jgi:hypothetical protein
MKAKILTFIEQVKLAFAIRKSKMHQSVAHKPNIKELEADETVLAHAVKEIEKLDDTHTKPFALSALSFLIELVVPVFSRWKRRNSLITHPENANISGHINANSQYQQLREGIHALLIEINNSDGEPLFAIQSHVERPAIAIVEQYKTAKHKTAEVASDNVEVVINQSDTLRPSQNA